MELYCRQTKCFLDLASGTFSIQADSQIQDLEGYTVCQSYDIKLVNNELNNHIIKGEPFDWNGERIIDTQILLMHNNAPILTGRLVYVGSDPDCITAVYQALPCGPVFEDFVFRERLTDYFKSSSLFSFMLSHIMERGGGSEFMSAKYADTRGFDPSDPSTIDNIKTYSVSVKPINNTSNDWTNDYQASMDNVNNYACNISAYDMLWPNEYISTMFGRYYAQCKLMDLVHSLGIHEPEYMEDTLDKYRLVFPCSVKIDRLFKVEYKLSDWKSDSMPSSLEQAYEIYYKAGPTTKIWAWDDIGQAWVEELEGQVIDNPFSMALTERGAFSTTIRQNKAVKDMEFVGTNLRSIYQLDSMQLSSADFDQNLLINMTKGQTFEENASVVPTVIVHNLQEGLALLPETIEVTYRVHVETNISYYPIEGKISNPNIASVPVRCQDIKIFDMGTGDFLNWLSLNVREFRWLRNPLYLSPDNAEVWGQEGSRVADFLSDEDIISMTKKVDSDAPSEIRVTIPMGNVTSRSKHLNELGNDEKNVQMELASFSFTNGYNESDARRRSTLPCVFNGDKQYGERYVAGDMQAIVGWWNDSHRAKKGKHVVHFWCEDNADADYLDSYQDHSVVYTVKCTNYHLHEYVYIDKTKYAVQSYKTDDFVTWELKLLKYVSMY